MKLYEYRCAIGKVGMPNALKQKIMYAAMNGERPQMYEKRASQARAFRVLLAAAIVASVTLLVAAIMIAGPIIKSLPDLFPEDYFSGLFPWLSPGTDTSDTDAVETTPSDTEPTVPSTYGGLKVTEVASEHDLVSAEVVRYEPQNRWITIQWKISPEINPTIYNGQYTLFQRNGDVWVEMIDHNLDHAIETVAVDGLKEAIDLSKITPFALAEGTYKLTKNFFYNENPDAFGSQAKKYELVIEFEIGDIDGALAQYGASRRFYSIGAHLEHSNEVCGFTGYVQNVDFDNLKLSTFVQAEVNMVIEYKYELFSYDRSSHKWKKLGGDPERSPEQIFLFAYSPSAAISLDLSPIFADTDDMMKNGVYRIRMPIILSDTGDNYDAVENYVNIDFAIGNGVDFRSNETALIAELHEGSSGIPEYEFPMRLNTLKYESNNNHLTFNIALDEDIIKYNFGDFVYTKATFYDYSNDDPLAEFNINISSIKLPSIEFNSGDLPFSLNGGTYRITFEVLLETGKLYRYHVVFAVDGEMTNVRDQVEIGISNSEIVKSGSIEKIEISDDMMLSIRFLQGFEHPANLDLAFTGIYSYSTGELLAPMIDVEQERVWFVIDFSEYGSAAEYDLSMYATHLPAGNYRLEFDAISGGSTRTVQLDIVLKRAVYSDVYYSHVMHCIDEPSLIYGNGAANLYLKFIAMSEEKLYVQYICASNDASRYSDVIITIDYKETDNTYKNILEWILPIVPTDTSVRVYDFQHRDNLKVGEWRFSISIGGYWNQYFVNYYYLPN